MISNKEYRLRVNQFVCGTEPPVCFSSEDAAFWDKAIAALFTMTQSRLGAVISPKTLPALVEIYPFRVRFRITTADESHYVVCEPELAVTSEKHFRDILMKTLYDVRDYFAGTVSELCGVEVSLQVIEYLYDKSNVVHLTT
jgi:hypothetical protein